MRHSYKDESIPVANQRREIAAILAYGVVRQLRKIAYGEIKYSRRNNSLDFLGETRLSVSHGTRDLGLPNEGADA